MTKTSPGGEAMREIPSLTAEYSETAANAQNRLYGPSGAMDYRVLLVQGGGAQQAVVVNAATGDLAAEKALQRNPGWKVAHVGPVTGESRISDEMFADQ